MKKNAKILGMVVFWLISLLASGYSVSAAEKPIVLTFSHFAPSVGIMAEQYKKWASLIEERTGGKVKIEFYWSASLMASSQALPGVASGVADMAVIAGGYFPTQLPQVLMLEYAYNASDVWVGIRAYSRLLEKNLDLQAELARNGMINIAPYTAGVFQLFTKDKWTENADFKGKVIRTIGGSRALWLEKLGAKPIFMQSAELYEAIERGAIWGFELNFNLANDYRHYEVTKTLVLLDSGVTGAVLNLMSLKKFNSLPKDIQKIIMETGTYWGENILARAVYEKEQMIEEEWKKKGITVVRPSAKELEIMKKLAREAAMELAEKQDKKLGTPGQTGKVLKALQSEVEQAERELAVKGYPWKR